MTPGAAVLALFFGVSSFSPPGLKPAGISGVAVTPAFFNPTLGQTATLTFRTTFKGPVTVSVLDRDGFQVWSVALKSSAGGERKVVWNGRDSQGTVVPDEAYSFRIELSSGSRQASYFPANQVAEMYEVAPKYYNRTEGTILYELPVASRVHMQTGQAVFDPSLGRNDGPVLKTIVNREPRAAGRVIEYWNGLDETGTLDVAQLPHLVLGISCWALPENSVIATGNRQRTFLSYAESRQGRTEFTVKNTSHGHHAGLIALEDRSPSVTVTLANGTRPAGANCWQVVGNSTDLSIDVNGPTASYFRKQPGTVFIFDGVKRLKMTRASPEKNLISLDLELKPGERKTFAVNWASDYGPSAPGIVCIERTLAPTSAAGGRHP